MSTLSDIRGLQAAYDLKQALVQTDDRLFGSQEGQSSGSGGSIGLGSLTPILSSSGRGFFRNAAKNIQPVIKKEDAELGAILEYKNDEGVSEYGQVTKIDEGIILRSVSAEERANLVGDNPSIKQITLTSANTVPLPPYKYLKSKKNFIDTLLSPIDWLALSYQNGPLGKLSENLSSRQALSMYLVVGIVLFIGFVGYAFYLVTK